MSDEYELVAVKRERVPEWVYRLCCIRWPLFGQVALIQPFRWMLHRDLTRAERIRQTLDGVIK